MSPDRKLPMIKRKWLLAGAVVALIGVVVLARGIWSTDGAAARAPQARPVPVETAVAERKTMPVRLTALGNVTPIASVAIKTQVDTTITAVHFRDGANVQKGDLSVHARLPADRIRHETSASHHRWRAVHA